MSMWLNGKPTEMMLFLCWSFIFASVVNSQAVNPSTCLNGGTCLLNDTLTGECSECLCQVGFIGLMCERRLTTIEGVLYFDVTGIPGQLTAATKAVEDMLRAAVNTLTSARLAAVTTEVQNATVFAIGFLLYVERPEQWLNYTSIQQLQNPINSQLSPPGSIQNIFGPGTSPSYLNVQLRVNECVSNWTNCHEHAVCSDLNPGYMCECDTGYVGDGVSCTGITCQYNRVPQASSQATQIVTLPNGVIVDKPSGNLPFGTTIIYTCPEGYDATDSSGNIPDAISLPTCRENGWTGSQTTCSFDLGLRIAVGMAVTSSLVIVIMVGYFVGSYCVKAERKAKAKKKEEHAGPSTISGYDNFADG